MASTSAGEAVFGADPKRRCRVWPSGGAAHPPMAHGWKERYRSFTTGLATGPSGVTSLRR